MKRFWWVVALVAVMALAGCGSSSPEAKAAVPTSPVVAPTAAQPAAEFETSGPIVVENQLDLAAQREGVVAQVLADAGDPARRGQLLALLDDRQVRAERDAAAAKAKSIEADLKNWEGLVKIAKVDLERSEEMRKADLNTQQQVEHDRYKLEAAQYEVERERHNLQNARATLQALELELEKTRITAPFDGIVARRYVRAGQKVGVGDRLFWVTATAPLRVKFTLPERFVGRLKTGAVVNVSASEAGGEKHAAKVLRVSPVVDPSSGTIEVLAELTGAPAGLRPGMTARIVVADGQ